LNKVFYTTVVSVQGAPNDYKGGATGNQAETVLITSNDVSDISPNANYRQGISKM